MFGIRRKSGLSSTRTLIIVVAALAMVIQCRTAEARRGARNVSSGGEYSFRLESGGRTLPTYNHEGYTYVEGTRGQRYSIRVQNHSAERIEAVVSVDGRDVITGSEGNYRSQRGYVIEAYGSVLIDGFRTSWNGVAAFRFTEIDSSYAARMGNAANVGVVGVAIFKERRPNPPPVYIPRPRLGSGYGGGAQPEASEAPACDSLDSYSGAGRAKRERRSQGIGTGYGENQYSPASETTFERRNSRRPNAKLAVYYDDRQGLISRGVIRRPRPYRPRPVDPHPFPVSPDPGFAPPPPPRYYWE